jgi:hypothetical protein
MAIHSTSKKGQMLIDDRVIDTANTPWRFDERLSPGQGAVTTLTGVSASPPRPPHPEAFSVLQASAFWSVLLGFLDERLVAPVSAQRRQLKSSPHPG